MSRGSSKSRRKKSTAGAAGPGVRSQDRAVYIGLIMIGAFAVFLAFLLTQGEYGVHALLAYLALIAILINVFTWRAYRGGRLARWQAALARVPLRWAGYGTRKGKPLETAHGRPEARTALLVCLIVSVVVLGGLGYAVLTGLV